MDSYYSQEELRELGLKRYGEDVRISRKASIYGAENISIGNHVRIDDFAFLSGYIETGNYVHVAVYSALYGGNKGIFIDDFVNISSRVTVYSFSDDYTGETMTGPLIPDKFKSIEQGPVHIEKHVIVGSTSVILPGVILREGSAFGSFSFINHDSERWSVNVGIPVKKVHDRKKDLLQYEADFLKEILQQPTPQCGLLDRTYQKPQNIRGGGVTFRRTPRIKKNFYQGKAIRAKRFALYSLKGCGWSPRGC